MSAHPTAHTAKIAIAVQLVAIFAVLPADGARAQTAPAPPPPTAMAWGAMNFRQAEYWGGQRGIVAVAAGETQSVALRDDGMVFSWGQSFHSCGTPYEACAGNTPIAASGNGAAVAASRNINLVLRKDGTVFGWGPGVVENPVPAGLTGVTHIATGPYLTAAIRSDGSVTTWTNKDYGQQLFAAGLTGAKAIAVGEFHALAVTSDGRVIGSGGEHNRDSAAAHAPAGLTGVVAVSAGRRHSLALRSDGTVVGWGDNTSGQATVPAGLTNVVSISAGGDHSLALKSNGTVVGWGAPYDGKTVVPVGLSDVTAIAAGADHGVAVTSSLLPTAPTNLSVDITGTAVTLRWNPPHFSGLEGFEHYVLKAEPGQVRAQIALDRSAPRVPVVYRLEGIDGTKPFTVAVAAVSSAGPGASASIAVGSTTPVPTVPGEVIKTAAVAWGANSHGQAGPPNDRSIVAVAAGGTQSLALRADGSVISWGENFQPCPRDCASTVPSGAAKDVIAVAASRGVNLVLRKDASVFGWGPSYDRNPPPALSGVKAIAAGPHLGAALLANGSVTTWGTDYGQNDFADGLTGAKAIAVGEFHALAVRANGTVVGSGGERNADSAAARAPRGLTGVVAVSAGRRHSLALKSDGTVVAWGANTYGQSTVPPGLTNVRAISAGGDQSLALRNDGTVVGWGASRDGEPNVPAGLNHVSAIAAGADHAIAVTTSPRPTVPRDVSLNAAGSAAIVSWTPPAHQGLAGITGYIVSAQPGNFRIRLRPTARAYRFTTVNASRPVTVTVTALTAGGAGPAASVRGARNDVLAFERSTGRWARPGSTPVLFGRRGDWPVAADYNADGRTDLAVFRAGDWHVSGMPTIRFGQAGDVPVPADYNGDGRIELAVFRPTTGSWYIRGSSGYRLGTVGDVPVPADYDGDGRADIAIFRPANAVWYITAPGRLRHTVVRYGARGDVPTAGDYNGDGVVEVSVYRPRTSTWYPGGSSSGIRFGQRGDVPVVGDYNVDGRADFAVYRPANGSWYVRGRTVFRLGGRGFLPVPPAPAMVRYL